MNTSNFTFFSIFYLQGWWNLLRDVHDLGVQSQRLDKVQLGRIRQIQRFSFRCDVPLHNRWVKVLKTASALFDIFYFSETQETVTTGTLIINPDKSYTMFYTIRKALDFHGSFYYLLLFSRNWDPRTRHSLQQRRFRTFDLPRVRFLQKRRSWM